MNTLINLWPLAQKPERLAFYHGNDNGADKGTDLRAA